MVVIGKMHAPMVETAISYIYEPNAKHLLERL